MAGMTPRCFLAEHDPRARMCEGRWDHVHLIPRQLIRREVSTKSEVLWHPATWVWACRRHHAALDVERSIRLKQDDLPDATRAFARVMGLDYFIEREYGA
jgi:hypothetical protein